ncbi:aldo/keto reductase [Coralloluteibacterium stylophorae]|uniref:Aldo/keto reductase n=1 Tax=Coralloluteibacterium stylophorae TaxID=1776034 RepID=A0A8J7VU96_9GAMM|nr:aldo/keto reductase [Coralloluteibacterium stylophorae]MBS7455629.1 aldo/keto reductase [Coralloluteibacterium stylophorae]
MPQLRGLGRSGLHVAPLAFGGNVFGWTADARTSFRLLDAFTDAGFNLVDTADVYSRWVDGHEGGESERVLGAWFAQGEGRRERVVLATKLGKPMGDDRRGLSPRYVREAVDASLRRLRTDRIDLYQAHEDDRGTPLEDTLGAFADLIREGKVRAIGASNYDAARLREALETSARLGLPRYESLQPHYNLADRAGYEAGLAAVAREHGIGVIPYFALAAGFLTGKYRSRADLAGRARAGMVEAYLDARGTRILAALDTVAAAHGATSAQVALAWLIGRPGITAPIVSATSLEQLEGTLQAPDLRLADDEIGRLDAASA